MTLNHCRGVAHLLCLLTDDAKCHPQVGSGIGRAGCGCACRALNHHRATGWSGCVVDRLQLLLSVTLGLEPLCCGIFLLFQAVDLGLIWSEWLYALNFSTLHKKTPCLVFTQMQG